MSKLDEYWFDNLMSFIRAIDDELYYARRRDVRVHAKLQEALDALRHYLHTT